MSNLDRLFYLRGIAPDFYDFKNELTPVSLENRSKLLEAMNIDISNEECISSEVFELDVVPWQRWFPPLLVLSTEQLNVPINVSPDALSDVHTWQVFANNCCVQEGTFTPQDLPEVADYVHDEIRYSKRSLALPSMAYGYYRFELRSSSNQGETCLAVTPQTAYLPQWLSEKENHLWGFLIQLYTLRSDDNWGIGDFSDLQALIRKGAGFGVDVIGLNPFHALQVDLKANFSPYSPSDRRFLNPLYIDVTKVDGFQSSFASKTAIYALRMSDHVNYSEVRELKYRALFYCFQSHALTAQRDQLAGFMKERGDDLVSFADYEAKNNWSETPGTDSVVLSLSEWLALLENNDVLSPEMMMPLFYMYLQYLADLQLSECQSLADALNMKVGLLRDLAVGANGGGAEVSRNTELFCNTVSVGAPPDALALNGQNWGLPPFDPVALNKTGFAHFITLIRANMAHCGALRIDHAMSLLRLWWCPPGESADKGAYIYYPFKEMLGLLCLESQLNQCAIIAEDLGTVPDDFREAIAHVGLFSNKMVYFEKWNEIEFKHPSHYETHALSMLNNHDMPTLLSWWNGTDLILRDELNLLGVNGDLSQFQHIRKQEKEHLVTLLRQDNLLPESWQNKALDDAADDELIYAIILFSSKANSIFFTFQLEDLIMMDAPVNVPSTYLEHDNWSRKLTHTIDAIFQNAQVDALLHNIQAIRKTQ